MFLPMKKNVVHDATPFGQGIPFLPLLPERVNRHALQPFFNCQSLHLDGWYFFPTREQVLVDNETLRVPRRGGFGLYGIICKVYSSSTPIVRTGENATLSSPHSGLQGAPVLRWRWLSACWCCKK
jgi:hypothetical protein